MSFAGASAGSRWHVYATKSLFVITENIPSPEAKKEVTFLGISRESGVTREGSDTYDGFQQKLKQLNGAAGRPKPQACSAVLGCLTAHQESFLLLAAEVTLAADADGQRIFEIARCEALPFSPAADTSSEAAAAVAGVTQLLGKGFYFSWDLDITRRLQQRLATPGALPGDLMQAADDRYAWNQHLVEPLTVQPGVSGRWFSPIIQGFIQMREFHGQSGGGRGAPLLLLLIARRSRKRAGTRYNARGLDDEGETGNWVETEQLVKIRRSAATTGAPSGWISLVQVRGSAPVFWEQNSAMQGISVTRGPQLGHLALEKHHRWIEAEYGHVFYVSLLSKTAAKRETEGVLSDALSGQLQMVSGLQWQHVDFNASVTGDEHRFDAQMDKLAQRLSEYANSCGYLDATQDAPGVEKQPPRRQQAGVIRTNCFDCLDRTNLLQQQLAWQWLTAYLAARPTLKPLLAVRAPQRAAAASSSGPPAALGGAAGGGGGGGGAGFGDLLNAFGDVLSEMTDAPAAMSARPALQGLVREMWAALGDALSLQYTGAASTMGGALRRGGHTALAVLEKGWRSVNRAYCAHFEDGARQSAMDLMLGKHKLPRAPGAMEARRAPCGQLTVAAVTWNCHGRAFWDTPGHVETLIRGAVGPPGPPARPPDVMVFCFQEMLALTAANVVTQAAGDAAQQERFEAAAVRALAVALGEPFVKVQGIGMVGLYVGAFVAKRLGTSIAGVAAGRKASGLYGQAGNKGAVGVRFEVAKTAVCALSVHLESGQNKAGERAAQLQEILLGATPFARPAMPVTKHDLVILAGDFNFRLALPPGADASSLRKSLAGGWPGTGAAGGAGCVGEGIAGAAANPTLLRPFATYDELAGDRGGGGEVQETIREAGLMEGPVLFPATYRLYEGSGEYDPERIPAWCDRVLHSKVGVVRRRYCALGGLLSSDHRPVGALLETSLLAVPGTTLPSPAPAQPPAASTGPADLLSGGTATTSGGASASASQPAETANAGHPPSAQQLPADLLGDGLLGAPAAGGGAAAATATTTAPPAGASGYPHQQKQPQQQRQPQQQQQQQQQRQQQQQQQQRSPTAASLLDASFDDALPPAAAPSPAPAPAPAAAAAAAAAELPGRPLPAAGVAVGQFVLAEHAGGWFFANVTRVGSGTCDVAWRRPSAATWGRDQSNERYLCSTGADETMHGDKIPVATRIRLPDAPGGGAAAAAAGGRAPETAAPAPAAGALPPPPPPDLLGEDPPAAAVDLLG